MSRDLEAWIRTRGITEVECLVSDISGVSRGKILPATKFLNGWRAGAHRIPESVFALTVTGDDAPTHTLLDPADSDVTLRPDPDSARMVPWYPEPTAQVICDCFHFDGTPVDIAPRQVLRQVLDRYAQAGWRPVVAPEVEFYLVARNPDPDYPLEPPTGRSGRQETGSQAFSIDAVNEFDPLFEEVYDFCEAEDLDIDTLNHECGAGQMEINFRHGDPLALADQVFLFKRTLRQAALRHGVYATFMAKPLENQPGSAMHLHQSLLDATTGENLFAGGVDGISPLFRHYIAGLQHYAAAVMPILAPNVNSYRRLSPYSDSTAVNIQWGIENRTCGLRVPRSEPENRRVEYRLPGADANPYLAIAAALVSGWLGMTRALPVVTEAIQESAYGLPNELPVHMVDALRVMDATPEIRETLGTTFVDIFLAVKNDEYGTHQRVISSWEREHLLLNV